MEPGTRFCPNHPGLKFPQFTQECTVCNQKLVTHDPVTKGFVPFQADEVAGQPAEEKIVLTRLYDGAVLGEAPVKKAKKGKK